MLIKIKNLLSHLKKNDVIFYVMAVALFGYLTKYMFNIILAHYLRPSLYGDFNIAIRVLGIITSFTLLGTNNSSKRFMSRYLRLHDHHNLQNYIKWNINIIRVSFSICILVALASYLIMHALHIWHIKDIRTYHLTIYMLWIAPLASMLSLLASYLLCAEHPIFYKLTSNMVYFLSTCVFLTAVLILNITLDSYSLISVLFISFSILIFIVILFIIKKMPYLFTTISNALRSKHPHPIQQDWVTVSVRMAANGLLSFIIFSLDLIIVEIVSPVENAVGLYAAALTISSVLIIIPQNLYSLLTVKVSELPNTEEEKIKLENHISQLNKYSMLVTLLVGVGIYAFSKTLLLHFGTIYVQADSILHILIIGFVANAYSQAATTVITYAGYEKVMLIISIVVLVVLFAFCIIMTYFFGILGTAIATSLTLVGRAFICHVIAYRKTHIKTYLV